MLSKSKFFQKNNKLTGEIEPSDKSDIEMAKVAAQLRDLENDGVVLKGNSFVLESPFSSKRKRQHLFVAQIKKTDTLPETCSQWIKRKLGCVY